MRSKPLSSTPPWSLCQFCSPGSCHEFLPWLPSVLDYDWVMWAKCTFSFPHYRNLIRTHSLPLLATREWDITEGWKICIRSWDSILAVAAELPSFLPKAHRFREERLFMVITSLNFSTYDFWVSLLVHVFRRKEWPELCLHRLDLGALTPASYACPLIFSKARALLLTMHTAFLQWELWSTRDAMSCLLPSLCSEFGCRICFYSMSFDI